MPSTEQQTNKLLQPDVQGSSMYGCPVFIVGFIIVLIVLSLFFL